MEFQAVAWGNAILIKYHFVSGKFVELWESFNLPNSTTGCGNTTNFGETEDLSDFPLLLTQEVNSDYPLTSIVGKTINRPQTVMIHLFSCPAVRTAKQITLPHLNNFVKIYRLKLTTKPSLIKYLYIFNTSMSAEKHSFNPEILTDSERAERNRIIADLKKGTEEYDRADQLAGDDSEIITEKSFPAVTEADLSDYDDEKKFSKRQKDNANLDINNLSSEEKITLFENQINELNERNEALNKSIDRKQKNTTLQDFELLTKGLYKNQQKITELAGKIAELEHEQDLEKAEQDIYNQEKPSFIKDEVISLAKAAGLNELQTEELLADNFTTNLFKKGYNPGNWENSQAVLAAELKARQNTELAVLEYEFPGLKLDTNGEPQLGFFGKLSGKINKIKASHSYQNYRAFTNLANHISENKPAVARSKPSSKMRSVGKIALAATAAAAIGGPLGKKVTEFTHDVDTQTNAVFSKKASTDTRTVTTTEQKSLNKFPEVVIAPVYNTTARQEETETRTSRRPKNSFTEEDTGEAINFSEKEGLKVIDTTASKRRAELHKKEAIENAFVAPITTPKTTELDGPAKPNVNTKPIGTIANQKAAKAVINEMFGDKLDQTIKQPIEKGKTEANTVEKTSNPNTFGKPDRFGMVEERVKVPSLSLGSRPDTSDLRNKNNDKIIRGLHQTAREQAEEFSKPAATTQRRDQEDESETEEAFPIESVSQGSKREMFSLKDSLPKIESPQFSVDLKPRLSSSKKVDIGKPDRFGMVEERVKAPSLSLDTQTKTRAELSSAGKEAAIKIKESISLREALRTTLRASGLERVLQDAYFYDATKKFDKLANKPAERANFVSQVIQAAKAGPDQLIEFLNQ